MTKPTVIFLMGSTASGKTDLAINLSREIPVDIISVDSALIYRDMNIGTAKPTAEELVLAPHALIDICDPSESYSVADFCYDATREIEKSIAAGRTPLLVGGTMMYFHALLEGLADMPATDSATREQIEREAQERGWPALHQELAKVDPEYATQIHPNHSQRIGRALAVYRISGKTMTAFRIEQQKQSLSGLSGLMNQYEVVQLALMPMDRVWLHQRIEQRYHQMLDQGFEDEVKRLYQRGNLHLDMPSMRSVGYRQMWQYVDGQYDYQTMVEKGLVATRQLAKRQITWLRRWNQLKVLEVAPKSETLAIVSAKNFEKALNFLSKKPI
ncbi:tRNA (adenosine(37)-N6)-dimethylallyltransferase MiaA [Candidatus Endobugula sertula]|uniref:tRNA dimethylallyltransferase n=1 Tax=Candidatus Endobugula sertula TaxID=62101 RepID=A0A1D2QMN1_9GAMM|nr:tRNA (adenosine(37)-N6)-dimethylallyltransferase MiaA [Candidatus Endobugula sertula]